MIPWIMFLLTMRMIITVFKDIISIPYLGHDDAKSIILIALGKVVIGPPSRTGHCFFVKVLAQNFSVRSSHIFSP